MKIFFKLMVCLFFSLFALTSVTAVEREEKIIYHVTDSSVASIAMRNARNHISQSPKVKIVFITNGAGILFLVDGASDKNGNPYDIVVQELAAKGVEFRVCNNSLMVANLDKSKLLPETSIVPSGVAEVSRLQIYEAYVDIKP